MGIFKAVKEMITLISEMPKILLVSMGFLWVGSIVWYLKEPSENGLLGMGFIFVITIINIYYYTREGFKDWIKGEKLKVLIRRLYLDGDKQLLKEIKETDLDNLPYAIWDGAEYAEIYKKVLGYSIKARRGDNCMYSLTDRILGGDIHLRSIHETIKNKRLK
ncbi:hypothetical protein COV19_02640 [Candidatus Woesearchaeota archaeon CG10_big_fil_rev_8_21_14_0_10_44_13]|nr:MAG: hypothetical protein COV19_02640 [Candidatus Woesearchaeota archaeon CG10_big_fil_rev_8_21_14_0_10_44_13]